MGIRHSSIFDFKDYLISSNLYNLVARSIESHTAGLMDIITAFQAMDPQREGLLHRVGKAQRQSVQAQRQADEAEATLYVLQLKYGLLQSKYDQLEALSTDVGRQAVAAFQASPEFLEIITSRIEGHRSEHVQARLETQEGRLWRAKEVLMSFKCGRYDMQKTLYDMLTELYSDFHPAKFGLPEIMPDPDEEEENHANDLSLQHLGIPDDLEGAVHGFDFENILNGVPENMPDP
ncbi:unnamed protein product [Cuscuta europaea]|uniref:Uncharacterized protein n=1 Tax=Cuscuta europaea TaxID=41803 RepID=A0A9P1EBA9_CUSEU|nr:unnamed protein product [Cuscuta europaea]